MRRRTEGERFFDWQGRRSRRPVWVADAGGRRQAKNTPPECRGILLGALNQLYRPQPWEDRVAITMVPQRVVPMVLRVSFALGKTG